VCSAKRPSVRPPGVTKTIAGVFNAAQRASRSRCNIYRRSPFPVTGQGSSIACCIRPRKRLPARPAAAWKSGAVLRNRKSPARAGFLLPGSFLAYLACIGAVGLVLSLTGKVLLGIPPVRSDRKAVPDRP